MAIVRLSTLIALNAPPAGLRHRPAAPIVSELRRCTALFCTLALVLIERFLLADPALLLSTRVPALTTSWAPAAWFCAPDTTIVPAPVLLSVALASELKPPEVIREPAVT